MVISYRCIPTAELSSGHYGAWRNIIAQHREFDNPIFAPEFVQLVANVRPNVEVAVIESGSEPVGFFPFFRTRQNVALPVANTFTDFQGVVISPGIDWAPRELLKATGLTAFRFDHVPAAQNQFREYAWERADSPFIDLSEGFDGYVNERRQAGSRVITHIKRKLRKIEREIGRITIKPHCPDRAHFEQLLEWKMDQFRLKSARNVLAKPWVQEMLWQVANSDDNNFRGQLSVLTVDDRPVAIHLGPVANGVLHWWVTAFDNSLQRYSPGLIHLLKLLEELPGQEIHRVDLGRGEERYKQRFKNGDTLLLEGAVDSRPVPGQIYRQWKRTRAALLKSPVAQPARYALRTFESIAGQTLEAFTFSCDDCRPKDTFHGHRKA